MSGRRSRRGSDAATGEDATGSPPRKQRIGTRFKMLQRIIALGADFDVENERGERVFHIDGTSLRQRGTLLFTDMQGHEMYRVQEKLLRVRDRIDIYRGDDLAARVYNALFSPLRDRFRVEIPGDEHLMAHGNVLYNEYAIERDNRDVARVSKQWFRVGGTYGVEVAQSEDELLLLAITVVIDMMSHEGT